MNSLSQKNHKKNPRDLESRTPICGAVWEPKLAPNLSVQWSPVSQEGLGGLDPTQFIGKDMTVRYMGLNPKSNIPNIAKGVAVRDYE